MILVSVDDHVVEPPDVFEHHLPAKYKDIAPAHRAPCPTAPTAGSSSTSTSRTSGSTRSPAGRPRNTAWTRRASTSSAPAPTTCKQRVLDMSANGVLGSLNFPSLPGFAGRLFAALDDKDAALALCRAYNDWHIEEWCGAAPDRFIPLAIPPIWDPAGARRRGAPRREEGLPRDHVPGEPGAARPAEPAHRPLGPVLEGVQRRRHDRQHAHRLVGRSSRSPRPTRRST